MSLSRVTTPLGTYQGKNMGEYYLFLGIPYAQAPVEDKRWRKSEESLPFDGVFDATKPGNKCIQQASMPNSFYHKEFHDDENYEVNSSEDCLNLNIWTSAKSKEDCLPVAVWIHGGAFDHGCNYEKEFDGEAFAKQGVILVTINYRLGILGFLAQQELSDENEMGASGNYGLLDQLCALRFIKKYISYFGGNPDNITLFGQSAGCMSVQYLISSPLSEGLFHKAILQSGGGYHSPFMVKQPTLENGYRIASEFFLEAGISSIEEARLLPASKIFEIQQLMMKKQDPKELLFVPVIDHYVLHQSCDEALENNKIRSIPIIIGSCGNEMNISYITKSLRMASAEMAKKLSELGHKEVYCYYFDRNLPGDEAGAFHSSELWYIFGTLSRSWRPFTEIDYSLSNTMIEYWTSFMKNGVPCSPSHPKWLPYFETDNYMIFDESIRFEKIK